MSKILKVLAASTVLASTMSFAQITGVEGGGGITGGGISGVSGVSGISGGIGSDFASSNVGGANSGKKGGLAPSLENAFGGGAAVNAPSDGRSDKRDE